MKSHVKHKAGRKDDEMKARDDRKKLAERLVKTNDI